MAGTERDSDAYGLDIRALKLMVDQRIPTHEGLRGLAEVKAHKTAQLHTLLQVLDGITLPDSD